MTGAFLGAYLRYRLPEHHLAPDSHDVIKLAAGLIATMTALVLGLVIAAAKGEFDEQNDAVKRIAADLLALDRVLARYGPESGPIRADVRGIVSDRLAEVWLTGRQVHERAAQYATHAERVEDAIRGLPAGSDSQRWLQSQALELTGDVLRTRWFMLGAAGDSIPEAFVVVLCCWLTIIFASFGLFAPRNGTVAAVLVLSGLCVAAAIVLILELDRPFEGVVRVSTAPLHYVTEQIAQ
jgi:hypothetical protein